MFIQSEGDGKIMSRPTMKKKRQEKIQHIVDVATEVFAEKGYHGGLTDDIADRAEISKRSMFDDNSNGNLWVFYGCETDE